MKNKNMFKTVVGLMGLVLALNIAPAQKVQAAEEKVQQETIGEEEYRMNLDSAKMGEEELMMLPNLSEMSDEERMEFERAQEEEMFREVRKDASGRSVWMPVNIYTYNADGSVKRHTDYTYNDAGDMTGEKTYRGERLDYEYQYTFDADGNKIRNSYTSYNEDGSVNHTYKYDWTYDANGNWTKNEVFHNDELSSTFYSTFEGNKLIKAEQYDEAGNILTTTEFVYEGDNCTLEKHYSYYTGTARMYLYGRTAYDANGNKTEQATYYISSDGTEQLGSRSVYTYVQVSGDFRTESCFSYNSENEMISGYAYEFNEDGSHTKRTDYTRGGEIESYTLYGDSNFPTNASIGTQIQTRDNVYDKNDNLISYEVTTYQLYGEENEENNGGTDTSLNGLICASDGNWYYYVNGSINTGYTGLVFDSAVGWWYVENGKINFNYNGLIFYNDAWWCVAGGAVIFDYTGLWYDPTVGWWYVENGMVNFNYNGLIFYNDAWWCVAGGAVIFDYTGLWNDPNVGWWYVENGMINFNYSGLVFYNDGWWCVAGGAVIFDYTGLWYDANVGWWYVENGAINFGYTGSAELDGNTYNVANGAVVF